MYIKHVLTIWKVIYYTLGLEVPQCSGPHLQSCEAKQSQISSTSSSRSSNATRSLSKKSWKLPEPLRSGHSVKSTHADVTGRFRDFSQRKLKYFSCTVADVLPMCHKSEREQRMEHQARRTNLDTDKTHTKQSRWKYRPRDLAVYFPRLYYIHQEEICKMCVKAFPDSLSGIVSWQHMYESVFLCALNMKKVSEWEGDSVGCMWVKSFVWKRSGFSTQCRLLSLSSFSFLSVPTVHNLSIKAEGGTEREHETETEKETQKQAGKGHKWRFEGEEETGGQRGLSSSILERGKIRKARMRGVLLPSLVLSQLYFTWLEGRAHVQIKRGRDDRKKERLKGW